jgi:predicted DNA-binding transcriptional regulator YafY
MDDRRHVRWELARRFELIEWRVFWQGRINRYDLEERFEISAAQASADLHAYQAAASGNIEYDPTERAFLPTAKFQAKFLSVSADRYLAQLNAIQTSVLAARDTWFGSPPPAAVLPALRTVASDVLRPMLATIRELRCISIEYQSLTNRRRRKIAPHALAFDGLRWHARAWCLDRREFRDFVLTRIISAGPTEPFDSNSMKDTEWHDQVELKIVPHPMLPKYKQAAIALDYGMKDGMLVFPIRIALSYYAIRTFNLDLDLDEIPPERKQIFLSNRAEIEAKRTDAKARTKVLIGTGA